jgi:UDP-GlcNAc:undecaprenyl-phosphate/decaprenyl-phosphate GlcNAc-1-phosphate transferase
MSEPGLDLYVITFVATLALTVVLTPLTIRLALRWQILDRPSPHKFHQVATPYLGGLAVVGAVMIALVAPGKLRPAVLGVIGAAVLMGAVGLLDDWRTIGPVPRLASQVVAAAMLWTGRFRLTPLEAPVLDFLLTVFVVVAVTNALNLLDNMDGLVPGTAAIAAAFFFALGFQGGQTVVAFAAAALAGACLGFLPYNFRRARIFLGDAGTLFIGFLLAVIAIRIELTDYPAITRVAIPWLILAVPLFDMALVVVSRLRAGRPVMRGATDHSSHRLVALGLSPRHVALVTYLVSAVAGGLAFLLLHVKNGTFSLVIVILAVMTALFLGWLLERVHLGTTGTVEDAGLDARSGPS